MPNWVSITAVMTFETRDALEDFMSFVANDSGEQSFDFNKIIPMPEILTNSESNSYTSIGYDAFYGTDEEAARIMAYKWVEAKNREELCQFLSEKNPLYKEKADHTKACLDQTGFKDWYEWSIQNWGTKWNACNPDLEAEELSLTYSFNTAWSFPVPIFKALAEKFPNADFQVSFTEEAGFFAGDLNKEFGSTEIEIIEHTPDLGCDDDDDDDSESDAPVSVNVIGEDRNNWF